MENQILKTITVDGITYDLPSGSSSHEYSTEEKIIGKWINGDPVYEKTLIVPDSLLASTGEKTFNFEEQSIDNIDIIIDGYMIAKKRGWNAWQHFPTYHFVQSWSLSSIYNLSSSACMFTIGNSYTGDHQLIDGHLIIQYTKSTD